MVTELKLESGLVNADGILGRTEFHTRRGLNVLGAEARKRALVGSRCFLLASQ